MLLQLPKVRHAIKKSIRQRDQIKYVFIKMYVKLDNAKTIGTFMTLINICGYLSAVTNVSHYIKIAHWCHLMSASGHSAHSIFASDIELTRERYLFQAEIIINSSQGSSVTPSFYGHQDFIHGMDYRWIIVYNPPSANGLVY